MASRAISIAALLTLAGAVLPGCGSSTTSVTAPSPISRCGITLQPVDGPVPAQGGGGTIGVGAARDCAWSATTEGPWLSIKAGGSGQGDGTVEFTAAANPDPSMRRGAVVLNGQRAEISQAAAACEITLAQSSASFGQGGGNGSVQVRASSAMCAWTATADSDWISLRLPNGQGTATMAFEVLPTTGPPRSGTITIAGQKFSVTQAEGCTYAIAPAAHNAAAAGSKGTVAVTTTAACPWTAASNVDWIAISQPVGTGPGVVGFTVAPTLGVGRTGSAVIAGQLFTVTQAQGCTYDVQPASHSIGSAGGTLNVTIGTTAGCPWSAASDVSWVSVSGATSGTGDRTLTLAVEATSGPARSGSVTVAGHQVTIAQSPGCTFSIAPETASVPSAGGSGKVAVTGGAGCTWTASSSASWLTITAGDKGSGNGEVAYSAASTTGPARSATMTIAGRTFTVNQGQGCTFTLSSSSTNIGDGGGNRSFDVQTTAGCGWTASTSDSWLSITQGQTGSGNGQVRFTVGPNSGPTRNGTITAGGQTFSVTQGSGCAFSISPDNQTVPAAGGNGTVSVTAANGCGWNASSNAGWLSITSAASGSGNGSVTFSAAAHAGSPRSGTLTIAGRTFTVNQGSGCTYAIAPGSQTVPAGATSVSVAVTAGGTCGWTASTTTPWLSVVSGASGTGNGTAQVDVQANAGPPRSGTVDIAGQIFTVNQDSGCTFVVAPEIVSAPAGGSAPRVDVTATGSACTWTAVSAVSWIGVTTGAAGSGNGPVDLSVASHAGPARSGTVTIAGRTVTVNQDSGCTFALSAASHHSAAGGSGGVVNVTTDGACPWTATSNAPWIIVSAGPFGPGPGSVQFSVEANATGAPRSGTITIAGQAFTVTQD